MTPYIKMLINERQRLFYAGKMEERRRQANVVEHHIKLRKKKYYSKFTNNKDSKRVWKIVKKQMERRSEKQSSTLQKNWV